MRLIMKTSTKVLIAFISAFTVASFSSFAAEHTVRARDLGIPFEGNPGALNAITDVPGVTVGHTTLIQDLPDGGAVRTGVTAILPRGTGTLDHPSFGGFFALNGNGEMTGTAWLEESGMLEGPILLTNTHSVGIVRDATIQWRVAAGKADSSGYWWSLPVVAETWDGHLNDINGFHITAAHTRAALENATPGPVTEGSVGGGTGMVCHEFKCGIGTASRTVNASGTAYSLGVLVQANYGIRDTLMVAGVPVGQHMQQDKVYSDNSPAIPETGSIIIVVATDAPLLPHQLKRLARRASLGLARNGSYAGNGSGDIFIAFSTANEGARQSGPKTTISMITNEEMDPLFLATVQATEEAIINALVAGRDMTGHKGRYAKAIAHKELQDILRRYNRLKE